MKNEVILQIELSQAALDDVSKALNQYSRFHTLSLIHKEDSVWRDAANNARVQFQKAVHHLSNLPPLPLISTTKTTES